MRFSPVSPERLTTLLWVAFATRSGMSRGDNDNLESAMTCRVCVLR